MDDEILFGHLVRERRRAADMTQEQFAELVGCSVDLIRKIEQGQRRPSRETAERLARILGLPAADLAQFIVAARAPLPAAPSAATPPAVPPLPAATPRPPPAPATPLIGRAAELARLAQLLVSPACRLITLTGPGGAGKTRLAIEAARQLPGGHTVAFAALEGIVEPALLPLAIAEALGAPLTGQAPPLDQLAGLLRACPALLILDNLEHLLAGVGFVCELLAAAPDLRILATSRERLGLRGEWLLELDGLPVSPSAGNDALALFALHLARARGGAPLTAAERDDAVRICRLLDGSPLAIELAAAWGRSLACAALAAEIARTLDFLSITARDLPPRQRSLRAAFAYSWELLDHDGRASLRRLAVFRGSFGYSAVAEVVGTSRGGLAALIDHSLLRRSAGDRYELHPLTREFAVEALETSGEAASLRDAHARHFLGLLAGALPALWGSGQVDALAGLLAEIDNLRGAWARAVAVGADDLLGPALKPLWYIYEIRGWYGEGESLFAAAAAAQGRRNLIWAELAAAAGWFAMRAGRETQALSTLEECLTAARALGEPQTLATALDYIGLLELQRGRLAEARPLLQESLALHRGSGNAWGAAFALGYLGLIEGWLGGPGSARPLLSQALADMRNLGDPRGMAMCLLYLGGTLASAGEAGEAEPLLRECLALAGTVGDRWAVASALGYLGAAARTRGEADTAAYLLREAAALMQSLGDRRGEERMRALAAG